MPRGQTRCSGVLESKDLCAVTETGVGPETRAGAGDRSEQFDRKARALIGLNVKR